MVCGEGCDAATFEFSECRMIKRACGWKREPLAVASKRDNGEPYTRADMSGIVVYMESVAQVAVRIPTES